MEQWLVHLLLCRIRNGDHHENDIRFKNCIFGRCGASGDVGPGGSRALGCNLGDFGTNISGSGAAPSVRSHTPARRESERASEASRAQGI